MTSLYYAHAMPTYNEPIEKDELALIAKKFRGKTIINPASYGTQIEKEIDKMGFCYRLIDGCNTLVFSKWQGMITG